MDTGTHFVMGIGLYGLAHLDPSVTGNSEMLFATLLGTVIGSQAPDMDTLYRLKGNAAYVRNHRGWTHSLPMTLIWPTVITGVLFLFLPKIDLLSLWLWTCLAVCIHIFIDCFNAYGTQALRPFRTTWISLNIINIFDPIIFGLHLLGFAFWFLFPTNEGIVFAIIYALLILYIAWRSWEHAQMVTWAKQTLALPGKYTVTPTYRLNRWNIIIEMDDIVRIGEIDHRQLEWTGNISRKDETHPATIKSKQSPAVASFLSFTSYGYPQVTSHEHGYEVKWLDVRYHHKKQFPFVAVAHLDDNYTIIHSFVGWLSDKRTQKKAENLTK